MREPDIKPVTASASEESGSAVPMQPSIAEGAGDTEQGLSLPPAPMLNKRDLDVVISLVYEELLHLASALRRNDPNATVQTGTLVHEAWLKLKSSPQLAALPIHEFKAVAAKAMRQVLVDSARKRSTRKRGGSGEVEFVMLDDSVGFTPSRSIEVLMLDRALDTLETLNPRQAKVVEYRFFLGMNVTETAEHLGVSESVVERDWRAARAWLMGAVEQGVNA
jgi:RNA polymerase sigma factor (TIGR02999 family)